MTLCINYNAIEGTSDSIGVGHMTVHSVETIIDDLERSGIPWSWANECEHLDLDDCGRPCHHLECPHCGLLIATPDEDRNGGDVDTADEYEDLWWVCECGNETNGASWGAAGVCYECHMDSLNPPESGDEYIGLDMEDY